MEKQLLITGANGFVGSFLCRHFQKSAIALSRRPIVNVENRLLDDLMHCQNKHFENAHTVIHCAVRAHVLKEKAAHPKQAFMRENVFVLKPVIENAIQARIQHFVCLSSAKVYGEKSNNPQGFAENAELFPQDDFALSKVLAEELLQQYQNDLKITIVRLPLLYGKNPKAHWAMLLNAIERGLPLPFGKIKNNERSFLALDNFADFLEKIVLKSNDDENFHPNLNIWNVCDGENLSTFSLLEKLGNACQKPAKLLPFPPKILRIAAKLAHQEKRLALLENSFVLNIQKAKQAGWQAPLSVDAAFQKYFSLQN